MTSKHTGSISESLISLAEQKKLYVTKCQNKIAREEYRCKLRINIWYIGEEEKVRKRYLLVELVIRVLI